MKISVIVGNVIAVVGLLIVAFALFVVGYHCGKTPVPSGEQYKGNSISTDAPPGYLSIRGERWYLMGYQYKDSTNGQTECGRRYIFYDTRYHPKAELREILWHEVAHAYYCYQGDRMNSNWAAFTKDNAEHEVVYEMGMYVPVFIRDNPEFVSWTEDYK